MVRNVARQEYVAPNEKKYRAILVQQIVSHALCKKCRPDGFDYFLSVFLVMGLLLMFACFTWTGGIPSLTDQSSQSGGFTCFGSFE